METRIWAVDTGAVPLVLVLDIVRHNVTGFFGQAVWPIHVRGRGFILLGDPADVVAAVIRCGSDVEEVGFEEVGEEGVVGLLSAIIRWA